MPVHIAAAQPTAPWRWRVRPGLRRGAALALLALLAGCQTTGREAPAPPRVALVIGNAAYENARPLNNPVNDAQDMCAALRRLGFQTTCRTNVRSRAEFSALLDEHANRLGPASVGVVYYAGHGVQVGGANFLVPTQDAPGSQTRNPLTALYGIDDLFDLLRSRPARLNVLMLDACRTELFGDPVLAAGGRGKVATPAAAAPTRLMRDLQALPRSGSGLATIRDAPPRTMVFYATAAKAAAFDGEGRNGPLTKHILRHIGTRGQTLEDFFKRVTEGVESETERELAKRQSPFTYGSFTGRFCFAGCPGEGGEMPPIN